MTNLSLLERARNMIAALQWAGMRDMGYCESCSDMAECCPLCEFSQHDRNGGHDEKCELLVLLQDLNGALLVMQP